MKVSIGYHPGRLTAAERRSENIAVGMFLAGVALSSLGWWFAWLLAK